MKESIPLNPEETVGKFGFQSSEISAEFFNSKAGIEVLEHIIEVMDEKLKEDELLQRQLLEEETKSAAILLGLQEEEEEKQDLLREDTFELLPIAPPKVDEKDKIKVGKYDHEIASLHSQLDDAKEEIQKVTEKYKNYDDNLDQVDSFIDTLESTNPPDTKKALEKEIERLEGTKAERDAEAAAIQKLVDEGNVSEAKARLETLNGKNLQIGTLKDMLAVTNDEKHMYNDEGKPTNSFKEAAYIVPKDKQLVKEGTQFYLLDKDVELTDENRETAKQEFENAQSEISSVKKLINSNRSVEMTELDKKIVSIAEKIAQVQEEKSRVEKGSTLSSMSDTTGHPSQHSHQDLDLGPSGKQQDTQPDDNDALEMYKL